jgi:ribosomal protein S6
MGRLYEALAIFPSSMDEDGFNKALGEFVNEIERLGGRTAGVQKLGVRSFARTMKKNKSGNYVRVGFEMDADKLDKFRGRLKLKGDVFRVQILSGAERARAEEGKGSQKTEERRDGQP